MRANRLSKEQKLLQDKFQEILDIISTNEKINAENESKREKIRELQRPFSTRLADERAALESEWKPIREEFDKQIKEKEKELKSLKEEALLDGKSEIEMKAMVLKFELAHIAGLRAQKRQEEKRISDKHPEIQKLEETVSKYDQQILEIRDQEMPQPLLIETMDAMFAVKQKGQSLPPNITTESLITIFSNSTFALNKWLDNSQIYERLTTEEPILWQNYYEKLLRRVNPDETVRSAVAKIEAYRRQDSLYVNLTHVQLALGAMTKYIDKYQGASEGKKQEQLGNWQKFKRWWARSTSPKGFDDNRSGELQRTHIKVERLAAYQRTPKRSAKNMGAIDLTGEKDLTTSKKVEGSTLNFNSLQLGIQSLGGQIEIKKKQFEEMLRNPNSELNKNLSHFEMQTYQITDASGNETTTQVPEMKLDEYSEMYYGYIDEIEDLEKQKRELEKELRKYLIEGLKVITETLENTKDKDSQEHILTEHHLFSSHRFRDASPLNLLKNLKSSFEALLQSLPEPKEEKEMKPKGDKITIPDNGEKKEEKVDSVLSMEEGDSPKELPSTNLRIK